MTVTRLSATTHARRNGSVRGRARRSDSGFAIPRILVIGAACSWRLLLVGVAAYAIVRVLSMLSLVVIPLVAALLLAALLRPLAELLHRRLPGPLSALLTLLCAIAVVVGFGYLIGTRFTEQLPSLIQQVVATVHQLRTALASRGVGQRQLPDRSARGRLAAAPPQRGHRLSDHGGWLFCGIPHSHSSDLLHYLFSAL
jgi:hypothetical protein